LAKGGGKADVAALVFGVAWMLSELGRRAVILDLDPQADLTRLFLGDARTERLWRAPAGCSIYGALQPLLMSEGGARNRYVEVIGPGLGLVPGDMLLSRVERELGSVWDGTPAGHQRGLRLIIAFAEIAQRAAEQVSAEIVLLNVGPGLGTIERAAVSASDHVVVPVAPDLYSLQALRVLGTGLRNWQRLSAGRTQCALQSRVPLRDGLVRPCGYVILRHGIRVDRAVGPYDRWLRLVPSEYRRCVLNVPDDHAASGADDEHCLGVLKRYHSLAELGLEARKPVFLLHPADGALGAYQRAVRETYGQYEALAQRLLARVSADRAQGM
jgi:chromosome partitioning protein